jgi:hypothetical protein
MTLKFNESKLWEDAEVPHAVGIEEADVPDGADRSDGQVRTEVEYGYLGMVFSITLCQQHLPVRLVSAATNSRWKFYAQVQRLSFHTAKTRSGRSCFDRLKRA